jgi:GT2 family glycosyltransferase
VQSSARFIRAYLLRILTEKFGSCRYLVFGAFAEEAAAALRAGGADADAFASAPSPPCFLDSNGNDSCQEIVVWLYTLGANEAETIATIGARRTDVVLLPVTGGDLSKKRPQLVESFRRFGLFPDYACDLHELDPEALHLVPSKAIDAHSIVSAAEEAFAQLNKQMRGVQRMLRTRMSELEAAHQHIASLEQKLVKLKEYRRNIKQLQQEKHALRKSPERKIGQVLLAPYRLPQKLFHEIRKSWPSTKRTAQNEYEAWFARRRVTPEAIAAFREEARHFTYRPCVSIVTPVFNTPVRWLRETVDSVLHQAYENWELILADDRSTEPELLVFLAELQKKDGRIVLTQLQHDGGISAASNCALELARGDWVGFLDHDDVLEPDALFQHVKLLQEHLDADLIYSDEDRLTEKGLDAPLMKPDWSPDFFTSCNYICHFVTVRRETLREVGGFRSEFDGAQDYDLLFRIIERTQRIYHVPRVLYHWRRSDGPTADNIRRKPHSLEIGRLAVEAHLKRTGKQGHVAVDWRNHGYWIKRDIPDAKKISIIIPVRDRIDLLRRCIDSLTNRTSYEPYEIVVVNNDSASDEAHEYFANFPHRLLHYGGPFNFSAINNFASLQTDSPWLLFLNNDTEIIESGWLTAMAEHVQRREVGAVGARLLFSNDTIQHGGVVVGVGGIAQHAFRDFPAEAPGTGRQLQVIRNCSAVTGACLLTRREVFAEVGGFDEEHLPVTFNDVDLCLKIRRAGYLIVYTPYAKLYHHEGASRRRTIEPLETRVMQERWADVLAHDPYYNPNFSRERADFLLGNWQRS